VGISSAGRQDAAPTVRIDRSEPLAHAVGDRVEFPDLTSVGLPAGGSAGGAAGPHVGTVVGHWERRDHWPERCRCPYLVLLDSGTTIYCPHTGDDFIRRSDVGMCTEYGIGSRVECRMGEDGRWFPGTVIQVHEDWIDSWKSTPPYLVDFDYGRSRPIWGNRYNMRPTSIVPKKRATSLRFRVGDRVDCSCEDCWKPGTVVKRWYSEEGFNKGHAVPYQIQLDNGDLIYAPTDTSDCIKRSTVPKKQLRFQPGMKVECLVEDGWLNGTITKLDAFANGRIVPYQIRIDSGDMRGDRVYAPVDNDRCVHLPARFRKGDVVEVAREGWRDHWLLGRVVATWVEDDGRDRPDRRGTTVPYKVEIDPSECPYLETGDELVRYVAEDDDRYVHMPARFDEGDRVECWIEGEWRAGTVVGLWLEDDYEDYVPYEVELDDDDWEGEAVFVCRDDDDHIRVLPAESDLEAAVVVPSLGHENHFVRAMSKIMIQNDNFSDATDLLVERIDSIRRTIDSATAAGSAAAVEDDGNSNNNVSLDNERFYLSGFLLSLADVHEAKGEYAEMKDALDESLRLIDEMAEDGERSRRRLHVLEKLALNATLTKNQKANITYLEEAIALGQQISDQESYRLGTLLYDCGRLNAAGKRQQRERGIEQMSKGVDILSRVCGRHDSRVVEARETLEAAMKGGNDDDERR